MKIILFALALFGPISGYSAEIDVPLSGHTMLADNLDLNSNRGTYVPPTDLGNVEDLNQGYFTESRQLNKVLKKVKYLLINGELDLAQTHLSKIAFNNTKLAPVIYRYLAISAFIEGDFQKSYEFLNYKELVQFPQYNKVCTLRILNQIVLNLTEELGQEWKRCRHENPGNFISSNLPWLEFLVELKLHPKAGITAVPFKNFSLSALDTSELKIYLKLAMFLNQEKAVIHYIPDIMPIQLQDVELREIIGQIYFRSGSFLNSYKFIKDLQTPNAENNKGNLYILRNKYELAYAQFKLALDLKQNSQNAMERLLPLAWLLGDWVNGVKYANRVLASPQTNMNKFALAAAFQVQKGSYTEAREILNSISQRSRKGNELDVTQLHSFAALMQNKMSDTKKQASLSCAQYDLSNCWLLFQLSQWDAFPVMVRRDEKIAHKTEWEKLTNEDIINPLKEKIYVNQMDIEELDDRLIDLVSKKGP